MNEQARSEPRAWPTEDPSLLALLPLVYAVWSDGILRPDEVRAVCDGADPEILGDRSRATLNAWLDPDDPPGPETMERLRAIVAEADVDPSEATSLVGLGLALAGARGAPVAGPEHTAWRAHLERIESSLALSGPEVVRELFAERVEAPREVPSGVLDVDALRDFLDRPHADLRRAVMDAMAAPEFRAAHDLDMAEHRERVMVALGTIAERGWGAIAFPKEVGGEDAPDRAVAVFETLAFGDLSLLVKFGVQYGLFGGSVAQLGSERHRAYLPDIASLDLPGCYAMTEIDHGSNVRDIETEARWDGETETFVVTTPHDGARKDWIGGAALHARMATVFAQLRVGGHDHGVHALLVPLRDERGRTLEGVRIEDCGLKVGLNGVDNGRIAFDGVRVPRENLLDRFGGVDEHGVYRSPIASAGRRFFTMLGTLVSGRISVAVASVSVAKTALTIAIRYSAERRQFGRAGEHEVPILRYRLQRRALFPRLAGTYALHFAARDLVDRFTAATRNDEEEARRDVEARAAGLKALASEAALETIQVCREACGGRGYLAENRFGTLRDDADIFTTFEGANAVLWQLVAKALLSEYRDAMGDLNLRRITSLLAERARVNLQELNPVVTRRTDEEHLRDPAFLASALRYREERLVRSAALRLRARIEDGQDSFDAMNACQDHLVALARAHTERWVAEAMREAVVRAPTPGLSEALRTLADLQALSTLEQGRAWFLESGYFEPAKSKAVRALVSTLCDEVAAEALDLVGGFGIDDVVLDAPAGT